MDYYISGKMRDMRGSAIREIFKFAADPSVISLAGGNPAPELFPGKQLAEIANELLLENPTLALQYGVTEGHTPLREAVKDRLRRIENIDCPDDDLIVVTGGQQGIELATKVLIDEDDTVLVEEPSFIGALNAYRSYKAHLVGVSMDEDGINVEALEKAIVSNRNVRFLYTIPTFQNPTGRTMSVEKRRQVYEVCKKHGVLILEDNPYGDLTFSGVKYPTIKSMDTDGIVLYACSFSKVLAPGLRLGFLCANKQLIQKIVIAKQISDVHTPMITQLMATEYLKRYDLEAAIVKMRENYAHKCATMLKAIEEYFPEDITYTRPGGGLFIWCNLGHGIDTQKLAATAAANKVVYVPGSTFMVDMTAPCSQLRLNYSTMSDERIVEGIKRLGVIFKDAIAGK